MELLNSGQVDFIVVNSPNAYLGSVTKIKRIKIFQDVFLANQSFKELKGRQLSFQELLEYPILMLDKKSTTSEFLHNLFQQHHLDLVPEAELSSNDLLIDLARIGLGIAFLPDYCIPPDDPDLFVVKTKEELPSRELLAVHSQHLPLSKAASAFLNYFEEV